MPFQFDVDSPGWTRYYEEDSTGLPPPGVFQYVVPWVANQRVVPIPAEPGPHPEFPKSPYETKLATPPASQQNLWQKIFGRPLPHPPAVELPAVSPEEFATYYSKQQAALTANATNNLSRAVAACRELGVLRVHGHYDGGSDESFTYFDALELRDGRRIEPHAIPNHQSLKNIDWESMIDNAATAIMGRYDAGEFELHGALTIDVDAFTIINSEDRDAVFPPRATKETDRMAHPYHHAVRSVHLFGGKPEDYLAIHDWFDESKAHLADVRHRALRHHSEGIFLCQSIFGATITNSNGKAVPVRTIGEQHVKDDLGWIPSVKDWLQHLAFQPWMGRTPFRPSSNEGAQDETPAPAEDGQTPIRRASA